MRVYILTIIMLAVGVRCQEWYQVGNPHFLDTNTIFPAIKEETSIKVVKFFSPWCKYCRYVKAYIDNYKNSHQIHANLKFYEFDCNKNGPSFCWQHFQVRAYPCVIIVNEKGETISRMDGLYPEDTVQTILEDLNNKAKNLAPIQQNVQNKQEEQKNQDQKEQAKANVEENKEQTQKSEEVKKQEQKKQEVIKQQQKIQEQIKQEPKNEQKKQEPKKQQEKPLQVKPQNIQKVQLNHEQAKIDKTISQKPTSPPQPEVKTVNPPQQTPQKINKQQVSQESVEKQSKVDPAHPQSQTKFVEDTKTTGSFEFVKYLFYLIGLSVGVLYAIKIFSSKGQDPLKAGGKNVKSTADPESQKRANPKISSRDIENQILVQEVPDENL